MNAVKVTAVWRCVEVTIPIRTVSESNARGHWAKRARRAAAQRQAVRLVLTGALRAEGIMAPCHVTLTRIAPSRGLDDDNLRGALKAVRDSVADAIGVDDGDPRLSWDYAQRRGGRREYAVVVRVQGASESVSDAWATQETSGRKSAS